MFSKKINVDVKKSTSKIQDSKKDSATRLKHLKLVLGSVNCYLIFTTILLSIIFCTYVIYAN